MIKLLQGTRWLDMTDEAFAELRQPFEQTLLDLGTGDGKFPYLMARETPSLLCFGIDAQTANFANMAWKAARKPSRGGLPAQNLYYLQADIPHFPESLFGIADIITIRLPWAGLLQAVLQPSPLLLDGLINLTRKDRDAWLILQLNMSIFEDAAYLERLRLPCFDLSYLKKVLQPRYAEAGLTLWEAPVPEALEPFLKPTSWQQRLRLGSQQRKTETFLWKIQQGASAKTP